MTATELATKPNPKKLSNIGLVAIGRNEGQRLHQCLRSVVDTVSHIVYVDSGSTDGSVELAQKLGASVVELDLSIPFTAARARNAGFEHLMQLNHPLDYVQFVDGDCAISDGWLEQAQATLDNREDVAVVCGRRRERFPDETLYNKMCDIEWDTPVGEAKACGGDAMMRIEAFQQVDGFNPTLIAGEEPELCVRLRHSGWKILRLDAEMTLHDAQMTSFEQWWKRSVRAGHAYAEGAYLHGRPPERHWVKESRSIWLWGLLIPLVSLSLAWPTYGLSIALLGGYPLLVYRTYRYYVNQPNMEAKDSALFSLFCVIAKFPNLMGQLKFYVNKLSGKRNQLIEYK